jgi:hypothetical protein
MSRPRVSVLMTAYNRAEYIGAAIESVLAQSFADFELVVVDDGSTDDTAAIAQGYARDSRVRVVVNDRNLGDYPNRNHAAALAGGELLKFHDSDDVMYVDCLDVMVRALDDAPTAAFALTASRPWAGGPAPMLLTPALAYARAYLGEGLFHVGPACALFRAAAFRRLGGFPELGVHSDTLFWMDACRHVNVLLVRADLFWYRVHQGQELRQPGAEREMLRLEAAHWQALRHEACPLDPAILERARRTFIFGLVVRAVRDVRGGRVGAAVRRLRAAGLSVSEWLTYLRPPERSVAAGTPHAPDRLAR